MTTVTPIRRLDFETLVGLHAIGLPYSAGRTEGLSSKEGGEESAEDDAVSRIRRKSLRILVVDDEDRFRASLVFKLQTFYDATVEEGETVTGALDKLIENRDFDLILMDILMPGMSGIEACEAIRARGIDIRIVLMSAYYDAQNRTRAQALDVTLLNKPLDVDALERILLECGGVETS